MKHPLKAIFTKMNNKGHKSNTNRNKISITQQSETKNYFQMKRILKPQILTSIIIILFISIVAIFNSCKTPLLIANKSGAQLWGENCTRCHNAPPPTIYSDAQWEAVGEHMRYKANLTDQEVTKVVAFLKSAN